MRGRRLACTLRKGVERGFLHSSHIAAGHWTISRRACQTYGFEMPPFSKTSVNLNLHQLKVGMILAQDLHLPDGLLLLAQDKPIDELALNRLVELDHKFPDTMIVSIKP